MDCYYQSKFFLMILKASHLPRNFAKLFPTFLYQHELTSINRYITCYKNPNNPSCVDHFLAKSQKSFFKTETILQGYQTFINWFYQYLSYIFQKRRLRRYHNTGILQILKRIILIKIFRIDFQQNIQKNMPLLKKVFSDVLNKHTRKNLFVQFMRHCT